VPVPVPTTVVVPVPVPTTVVVPVPVATTVVVPVPVPVRVRVRVRVLVLVLVLVLVTATATVPVPVPATATATVAATPNHRGRWSGRASPSSITVRAPPISATPPDMTKAMNCALSASTGLTRSWRTTRRLPAKL
jgi:hypothetical protein